MDPKKLTRDASKVHSALKELDDGSVVAIKPIKILIPARFAEQQLAMLGSETNICGLFAIVVDDQYYGVSSAMAMMRIEPTITNTIKCGEDDYLEFVFDPGSIVISSTQLVKADSFIYLIYSEIMAKGNVPWFMTYEDMGRIFDSAPHHAGVSVGANFAVIEMIMAAITRSEKDRTKFFRHGLKDRQDLLAQEPAFIPLRSVTYGASNTTAKLIGAYWEEGLTSALVNPTDTVEPIEGLLRR